PRAGRTTTSSTWRSPRSKSCSGERAPRRGSIRLARGKEPAMATTEPEPPPLSAADIANRTFARRRKGVNPDEVQAFLQSLAEQVARLQAQVDWHRARTDFLERQTAGAKDAAYARL